MVLHNTWNYCFFLLCQSSNILKNQRTNIPYHCKHSHLYGLPKFHKPGIFLRHIVSSIDSPCFALAGFLQEVLSPLAGKSESFVKNLGHFIQLLMSVNLQTLDTLVSTDVPIDETLQVIRNMLHNDNTLVEWSALQVKAIMELVEVCLRTTYFKVDYKFFHPKDSMVWEAVTYC